MRIGWTDINSILAYLKVPSETPDATLIEWAYQALRKLKIGAMESMIVVQEVIDYRTELPKGFTRLLDAHGILCGLPQELLNTECDTEQLDLNNELLPPEYTQKEAQEVLAYYKLLFTESRTECFKRINLSSIKTQTQNCFSLTDPCSPYGYVRSDNQFIVSFKEGFVLLVFQGWPTDNEGNFLVPDHVDVLDAISTWVQSCYWETRMNMKEQGAFDLHNMYHSRATILLHKARTTLLLEKMDWQSIIRFQDRYIPFISKAHKF